LLRRPPKEWERIPRYERSLGNIRIYLDDIDSVHALLIENCGQVAILAGASAEAERADDLVDARDEELAELRVVSREPRVYVSLSEYRSSVICEGDDAAARRIADDVAALLEPCRHWSAALVPLRGLRLPLLVCVVSASLLLVRAVLALDSNYPPGARIGMGTLAAAILVLALSVPLVLLLVVRRRGGSSARVIPERRGNARGWSRERRNLWTVGILGVLAAVVIFVLGLKLGAKP